MKRNKKVKPRGGSVWLKDMAERKRKRDVHGKVVKAVPLADPPFRLKRLSRA